MKSYEEAKDSIEYFVFLYKARDYLDEMGFTHISEAMDAGFLFTEFLKEVA